MMNEMNLKISRGEVFYITSMYNTVGSEQRAGRPAVVVSNNINNEHSECVEICYLTLQTKTPLPTHVFIDRGKCINSTILCEQVTTVSKERVGDYMCRLPDDIMEAVDKAIIESLGLSYSIEKNSSESVSNSSNSPAFEVSAIKKQEASLYKKLYNELLDRIMGKKV